MEPIDTTLTHEPINRPWTPEEDSHLAQHAAGGWTAAEIGTPIGRNRNAVIGRCHRLGIKLASNKGGNPRRKRTARVHYSHLTP